jgi:uncharacterized protein YbjT (DUF2867 family)
MLLITGATGNVGRELTTALGAIGVPFRALARERGRLPAPPPQGEVVIADLDRPATLAAAFDGVDKLFLVTPGIGLAHAEHAVAAARRAGVRHIVHLSSAHVLGDPMPAMGRWHHDREELIRASRIPATFLRPGGFMTNALDWLPTIGDGNFVLDPTGPGRFAPIDPADIAAVAALVLTADDPRPTEHVLTGGAALTLAEQVRILATTLGHDIEVRPVATPAEAVRARFPHGAPPALATAIAEAFALIRADPIGLRTDTVQRLLGRPPATFGDWCTRNAHRFSR